MGTFSKVLAPALRVGWTVADELLIDKLALAKQAADLQSSTFNQYIALEMVQRGLDVAKLRMVYRERRDAMLEALQKHFPSGATWTRPAGGLFLWVTLPAKIDAMALLPKAVENNVTFVPGEDFHADHSGKNTIRLNFSNAGVDDIHAGIERLGSVIKQALV
jgi:DNA-binding transcriptional MocR family regulator